MISIDIQRIEKLHVNRFHNRETHLWDNRLMNDEQPKNVAVVLTEGLASRSLAAAHAAGVSRSELVRQLLTAYVDENGTEYE